MDNSQTVHQTFAKRLKGLREAAGLTQQDLAEQLQYSRGSISYYENCERVPDIVFLMTVSKFFDVGPHFLLGFSNNQTISNEDIGARFGLTDTAIEILEGMPISNYGAFISAFIEHPDFPKLLHCMESYTKESVLDENDLHHFHDRFEFRHFQLSRIFVAILRDLNDEYIPCGRTLTALDNINYEDLQRFLAAKQEHVRAENIRILKEFASERTADRLAANQALTEEFETWSAQDKANQKARTAAQKYAAYVDSSKGEK